MSDRERYAAEVLARLSEAELRNLANAEALRDAIVHDAERFRGRAQDDDVTIVVARVTIGAAWT